MPKITYQSADGAQRTLEVADGMSVMQGAVAGGVDGIVAECGGNAMCATCHVYVEPARVDCLSPMQSQEDEMLECVVSPREPNSRLSCQLIVTTDFDGLLVTIPRTQT